MHGLIGSKGVRDIFRVWALGKGLKSPGELSPGLTKSSGQSSLVAEYGWLHSWTQCGKQKWKHYKLRWEACLERWKISWTLKEISMERMIVLFKYQELSLWKKEPTTERSSWELFASRMWLVLHKEGDWLNQHCSARTFCLERQEAPGQSRMTPWWGWRWGPHQRLANFRHSNICWEDGGGEDAGSGDGTNGGGCGGHAGGIGMWSEWLLIIILNLRVHDSRKRCQIYLD